MRAALFLGIMILMAACVKEDSPPSTTADPDQGIVGDGGPDDSGDPTDMQALGNPLVPRVSNTTCRLPAAPPLGAMALEEVWPSINLERPVALLAAPDDSGQIYVLEQGGLVQVFDPERPGEVRPFIDRSVSRDGNEEGLLGLAFHPGYAENGRFFLYYSASNPRRSVISEFQAVGEPRQGDLGSEQILMEIPQPFANHNGGDIQFGPDGYLYIALGDGGSAGDPRNHAQRPETVLGSILRVDINSEDAVCGTPYGIPADNPFYEGRCQGDLDHGRPEVYAWGIRNIWRMAFDAATQELWVADVGQDAWEEIDIIQKGGNYGWHAMEGDSCFQENCDPENFIPPVFAYDHDEGRSITGGFVYRGPDLPELWGKYIFADYVSGKIWALDRSGDTAQAVLLVDTNHRVTGFGQDGEGRLYILTFTNQRSIFRLKRRENTPVPEPIPELLSDTGCFTDIANEVVAPGVIPYAPNAPFWSDNAEKIRYFALPDGTQMTWVDEDGFEFPEGSLLIKDFAITSQAGVRRKLEVRILRRETEGWAAYVYRYNAQGTDAVLLTTDVSEDVEGPDGTQPWLYPNRAQCDQCHLSQSRYVLAVTGRQFNGDYDYGTGPRNQLEALSEAGYLTLPAAAVELPKFVNPYDSQADLNERARAWLDTNCAGCHLPGSPIDAEMDLRGTVSFGAMQICNVEPRHVEHAEPGDRLLIPGNARQSVLYQRLKIRGDGQMPPLGTFEVDTRGRDLIGAWIQQLQACPPQ